MPFIIATKITKYLGFSLTEDVPNLHTEKYEAFLREIKDRLNRSIDSMISQVGNANTT